MNEREQGNQEEVSPAQNDKEAKKIHLLPEGVFEEQWNSKSLDFVGVPNRI